MNTGQRPHFNENDSRYKCCCGSIHVKTGALIIAVVGLVLVVLSALYRVVLFFTSSSVPAAVFGGNILGLILALIVYSLLFYGLRTERAVYLLPYLVLQIIALIFVCVQLILGVVILANNSTDMAEYLGGKKTMTNDEVKMFGIIIAISAIVTLALQVWFFWVVFKCYKFFKDQDSYAQAGVVYYSSAQAPVHVQPAYAFPQQPNPTVAYDNQAFQKPPPAYIN